MLKCTVLRQKERRRVPPASLDDHDDNDGHAGGSGYTGFAEAKASGDAGFKALIEGVDITERAMLSTLERHGVKKLEPQGEKFDPNFHQAMYEVPDASVPSGTVVQIMQAGYTIGDRVLRPALVGVAKGGAKPAPAANTNEPSGAPN